MNKLPEKILEEQLVRLLQDLGYEPVIIPDENKLIHNLKRQLEKHNKTEFSDQEFDKILNILSKGSVFEKAKTLREKQHILRDNGDNLYFEFINTDHWCQNQFQVTHQITMDGMYQNRYDVTILINGLPLVQIELKRSGIELKEAFNQVNRYQRHSFGASYGLFQYVQIFVISNGVDAKYYANNRFQSFKQTFFWTDTENKKINYLLNGFAPEFLEPCHLSKMICKYIVLNETKKIPMILRPYQYYAVEAIVEKVINSTHNGYIWHTTGSGKTLTSFKASQIITKLPNVKKVVFVVDRKDLDYQTTREFDSFRKGCVDATSNTSQLVEQLENDTKLIVTTIQKLNSAISKKRHYQKIEKLQHEKVVFIFDECHRTQFGETHKKIREFFKNIQLFGFTGTPIFSENAVKNDMGKRTTKELFGECLHKYVITDAIRDENVLKFSVEYVGRYRNKDSAAEIDIEVEEIDTKELMDSTYRLEKISDYIILNHNRKTHSREFNSIFCVSSIENLIKYYDIFKKRKEEGKHNLKIATVFSYSANEDDADANGFIPEELSVAEEPKVLYGLNKHSREKLDEYIADYNRLFGSNFSTKDSDSFYKYYNDISKKVKERQIDILLVVNMYLTGFDSVTLNTLYVDKNLKYHGLIQAYSRTNRILNEKKSQGNIVVFRNLKKATDDAITLFSNKDALEEIIIKPYEKQVEQFNDAYVKLVSITPTVKSVDSLVSEVDELEFIKAFRELLRLKNVLVAYSDFDWEDLAMEEQKFEDFKSKYLDLYDKVKFDHQKEKVSILDDVDFELELIHRDEINVTYILQLLIKLKSSVKKEAEQTEAELIKILNTEVQLRSKKELIEKFIKENIPQIDDKDLVPMEFQRFWDEQRKNSFEKIIKEENLIPGKAMELVEKYLYSENKPLREEILELIEGEKPKVLERKKTGDRILQKIMDFVETFFDMIAR